MITITLPYPPAGLSPNARLHFQAKHKLFQQYKGVCHAAFASQLRKYSAVGKFDGVFQVQYCPPTNNFPDRDNATASCKALFDGMAAATGLNDKSFYYPVFEIGPVVAGGAVKISFEVKA